MATWSTDTPPDSEQLPELPDAWLEALTRQDG